MKIIPKGLRPVNPILYILPPTKEVICGEDCYSGDGIILKEEKAFRHSFFTSPYIAVEGGKKDTYIHITENLKC